MQSGQAYRSITGARQAGLRYALGLILGVLLGLGGITPAAAALNEDDLLLLDLTLERQRLASSVTAYAVGTTAVVSLVEFGAALKFPIEFDPASGIARGSFIRPERTFTLDTREGFVDIEGQRTSISARDVVLHQDTVFVSLDALARWFPVDLELNKAALAVEVAPRERLPFQEREARRKSARSMAGVGPATLPPLDTPYRLLGPPAADVGLGYFTQRRKDEGRAFTGLNYSALLSGDVAYMDARVYLGGSNERGLDNMRASLSRDRLGLPLGLRYVEFGDIVPAIVPGLNTRGVERGMLLQGGGSVTGRDDLIDSNTINISGDALEGWDVELFQAGMRVGFQTVGPDGRYNFTDLDPLSGENVFELVFYGPSGERRSETVTRYSGLSPDQPGSVRYQLSVSEKGRPLYEGDDTLYADVTDRGSTRTAAGMEVRVLPALALRGSWTSVTNDGRQLDYTSLGFRTGWRELALSVDATRDPLGGTRWDGALQLPASMNLWGFDTRFIYTQFAQSALADSVSDTDANRLRLSRRAGVAVSGPVGPVATRFGLFHNREVDGRTSRNVSAGFTARADRLVFGNTLSYFQFDRDDNRREPDQLRGDLFFSTRFHPLSVRGGMSYTLKPEAEARQYFIDSNLRVARDMSMTFGLTHDPVTRLTRYISGFNWQLPEVTLSPRVTYDSEGVFSGFVYASFSLAPRPDRAGLMISGRSLATSGTVAARVFMDNDGSGDYSDGDQGLPNVTVRAPQSYRNVETDDRGVAYLTGLSSARATDVALDAGTLPDTLLVSTNAGNSVRPRPTAMAVVDFPVVPTGEIDGRVYASQQGRRVPLAGAMVELLDASGKVVDFAVSAADGFFVFAGIPYASYTVELKGERRKYSNAPMVVLSREHKTHSNIDIIVDMPKPADATLAPRSALPAAQPAAAAPVVPSAASPSRSPPSAPAPRAAPPRPTPVPAMPARRPGDGRLVQLGVFSTAESARAYRQDMLARGVVRAEQVEVVAANLGARGVMHRVLVTPLGTTADALCASLKARGTQCISIVL